MLNNNNRSNSIPNFDSYNLSHGRSTTIPRTHQKELVALKRSAVAGSASIPAIETLTQPPPFWKAAHVITTYTKYHPANRILTHRWTPAIGLSEHWDSFGMMGLWVNTCAKKPTHSLARPPIARGTPCMDRGLGHMDIRTPLIKGPTPMELISSLVIQQWFSTVNHQCTVGIAYWMNNHHC